MVNPFVEFFPFSLSGKERLSFWPQVVICLFLLLGGAAVQSLSRLRDFPPFGQFFIPVQ